MLSSACVLKLGKRLGNDQRSVGVMPSKAELVQQLKELGVEHSAKMTLLELDALVKRHVTKVKKEEINEDGLGKLKSDPMANLQGLHRATLRHIGLKMTIPLESKVTKGEILLQIRENLPTFQDQIYSIGKYKDTGTKFTMGNVAKDDREYMAWVMKQKCSHRQLSQLQTLGYLYYMGEAMKLQEQLELTLKEEWEETPRPKSAPPQKKPPAKEFQIHTEESEGEISDFAPKPKIGRRQGVKTEEDSEGVSSATSWMELGEKRKESTKMRR